MQGPGEVIAMGHRETVMSKSRDRIGPRWARLSDRREDVVDAVGALASHPRAVRRRDLRAPSLSGRCVIRARSAAVAVNVERHAKKGTPPTQTPVLPVQ